MDQKINNQNKKKRIYNRRKLIFVGIPVFALILFVSCTVQRQDALVIWTDRTEFASYVELFNSTHNVKKAVVIYKAEVARALPPARDEIPPDIVVGSWLKNSNTKKHFRKIDYLLHQNPTLRNFFYPKILSYGKINDDLYLLPVSFNLPMIIFNKKNEVQLLSDNFFSLDEIEYISGKFNQKTQDGTFSAMGYAPSWNGEFLYLVTKLLGVQYRENGKSFSYDVEKMQKSIEFLKDWTLDKNSSTSTEKNFQFRYLYMPKYAQVLSDRCLFGYMTSEELFTLSESKSSQLSFRWIAQNGQIPVEDNIIMMGIPKKTKHSSDAEEFIRWFMQEKTQELLLEREQKIGLNTIRFGIAGGFSSIKNVTEKLYPSFYRRLLGNLPQDETLCVPEILPNRWLNLKSQAILPFLQESTDTDKTGEILPLEMRVAEWGKRYF